MGITQRLGTLPLAISTDASNNIGIGGSPSGSYKLQVTGTTNLTGALSGTSATFSGNVGIGTSSPTLGKLQVEGSGGDTLLSINNTTTNAVALYMTVYTSGSLVSSGRILQDNSGNMRFFTGTSSDTERMRITNSGYALIGTVTSTGVGSGRLQVSGTATTAQFLLTNTGGHTALYTTGTDAYITRGTGGIMAFGIAPQDGSTFTEHLRITSGGGVLIGTSSSLYGTAGKLEILYAGSSQVGINIKTSTSDGLNLNFLNSSGTQVGYIYTTTTNTQYSTTSDYRLKEDLKDFNGLDLISSIKMYDYQWKSNKSRMHGVLAHQLAEIIPYAVSGEKDGDRMQGVDYSMLVPILTKAIQEQQAQIQNLQEQINAK